jgi:hypothetical protein
MSRKVLEFVTRAQWQNLMRGRRAYAQYKRTSLGLKFSAAERLQEQAEDQANDRKWASSHGRLPSGGIVLRFVTRDAVQCQASNGGTISGS